MFNAGQVSATLSGNFSPAGFMAFDSAMKKAHRSMDDVDRKGGAMNKTLAAVGKVGAVAAAGGILGFGIALTKSVQAAGSFEAKMRNVNTIAKLSETRLDAVGKSVLKLATQTGQMPTDLAEGLYDIVSSGFKADDALKILEKSAAAASAGLTTTAVSTKAVVAVLNAYQLGADQAGKVSDQLFGIVDKGVITFEELAGQIGDLLPYAPKLGLGLQDIGGAIATITKGGVPATETMTQIKGAMIAFLSPSEQMAQAVKRAGFESGEALVKSRGLQGALEAVAGTTDGTATAMRGLFPDVRGLSAALALTGDKAKTARADLAAMGDVSGKTAAALAEQSKGYEFAKRQFKAALSVAGIELGTGILPGLTAGVKDFSAALGDMSESGDLERFGQDIGRVLSSLGENLPSIIAGFKGIGSAIGTGFSIGGKVLAEFYREVGILIDGVMILAKVWNAINIDDRLDIPLEGLQRFHDEIDATKDALLGVKKVDVGKIKISADATQAVAALNGIKSQKLRDKVFDVLAKSGSAESKVKALIALGIPRKTAEVIARTEQALGAIAGVRSLMAQLTDKQVNILVKTTRVSTGDILDGKGGVPKKKRAAGRGPGGTETALVGEEAGHPEAVGNQRDGWAWVTVPTIMDLRPEDAVVPSNPARAGGALGLMAAMLGIPGYAKGKKPKKKTLAIPDAVRFAAVPEDALGAQRDDARESYQKRKERVRDLDVDIRAQRKKVGEAKGDAKRKARAKLTDMQKDRSRYQNGGDGLASLDTLRQRYNNLKAQFAVLHKSNLEIERLNTLQETDRTKMATASRNGNESAWTAAKGHRGGILARLRDLYAKAVKFAKPGTNFAAELEGKLAGVEGEIADAGADAFSTGDTAADRLRDTGMTDAERARLLNLEAAQSLAGLTATLDDDKAAAGQLAGFFEGILGAVQSDPSRGGAASVRDIADRLKSARDNVASFTGGGANDNADLQAQINQRDERISALTRESAINAGALSVFQGAGDIGMGSPGLVQNNYMLHPSDPQVLATIAGAAVGGISQQASRTSARTKLGL